MPVTVVFGKQNFLVMEICQCCSVDKIQGNITKNGSNFRKHSLLTEEMPPQIKCKFMDAMHSWYFITESCLGKTINTKLTYYNVNNVAV